MKNKLKKIVATAMAAACVLPCFAACGSKNDENTLVISAIKQGYGVKWLEALGEKFEEKKGVKVKIYPTVKDDAIDVEVKSGASQSDLLFESFPHWERIYRPTMVGSTTYDVLVEDLTELYKTKIPGENVTIEEKFSDYVTNEFNLDGKYYHFSWVASQSGIVYNKKVWNSEWKVPRTTNELIALCDTIKQNTSGTKIPFVYSLKSSYWGAVFSTWAAQYEGLEAMAQYNAGYDSDGNRYVPEMVLYDGFERCLEVMETLLKHENGYTHPNSKEYNFTDAQVKFLEGEAVMQPNGDWLQSEMSANFSADEVDIEMMKTPIISSITEKCSAVKTEEQLLQVIDYIDGVEGATLPAGLSDDHADVKKIREARAIYYAGLNDTASIPVYSTKKDLAKEFLQFMASDEGIETYCKASGGYRMHFKYDYEKESLKDVRSGFLDSTLNLWKTGKPFCLSEKDRIFLGGMQFLRTNMNSVETYLSATNGIDRLTANQIFMKNYENVSAIWDSLYANVQE